MNDELFNMMLSLCPPDWKYIRVMESGADSYLDFLIDEEYDTKWVFNLDEDCFLINHQAVENLVSYLQSNDYDYCGIQDGGSIPVRIHNPLVSNPFFNLFNTEKINHVEKDYYDREYNPAEIAEKYSHFIKHKNGRYEFDLFEPFYRQFFWLLENGFKPFFMNARPFDEEKYLVIAPLLRVIPYYNSPTMLLDHNNEELALHTWHSRFYNYPNIKKRIKNCYNYAKTRSRVKDGKKDVKIVKL